MFGLIIPPAQLSCEGGILESACLSGRQPTLMQSNNMARGTIAEGFYGMQNSASLYPLILTCTHISYPLASKCTHRNNPRQ
jgi:hypothetical protein